MPIEIIWGKYVMAYRIDKNDGILTFTIDREEKRNAVNDEVMDGLQEVITYIRRMTMYAF